MTFLTILGVAEILCGFSLVLKGKTGKEIPKSSRLEFFLSKQFFFIRRQQLGLLNRGGIADVTLLRILLAIRQKS